MGYVALLRGVNVGGNRKVDMKRLKKVFESLGCVGVRTYLNSGNVMFESDKSHGSLQKTIPQVLSREFGFEIKTLIKSEAEMSAIARAIPLSWENNVEQKTDVAYLFPEVDSKKVLSSLPIKKEFISIRYVKGAIIWNVKKSDYNRSHLNKIIGLELYNFMTVRNVNTARFLAKSVS